MTATLTWQHKMSVPALCTQCPHRGGDVHTGGQVDRHHQHRQHLQCNPESDAEKLENNERHHHTFFVCAWINKVKFAIYDF